MTIRYKVLRNDLTSPYRYYHYEIGKWYHEPLVGTMGQNNCQCGLYAVPIEGLLYRGLYRSDERAYKCEVKGRNAGVSPLKECWEHLKIIEPMSEDQVRRIARHQHKRLGWNIEEALYPINPLKMPKVNVPTSEHIKMLKQWASVRDSVWDSVRASVWASVGDSVRASVRASVGDSVWDSVWDSVRASVGDSVGDSVRASVGDSVRASVWASVRDSVGASVWAYIGSLFPGAHPFKPASDLWRSGIVPSFDGKVWRLHSGEQASIIWKGTSEDLKNTNMHKTQKKAKA